MRADACGAGRLMPASELIASSSPTSSDLPLAFTCASSIAAGAGLARAPLSQRSASGLWHRAAGAAAPSRA